MVLSMSNQEKKADNYSEELPFCACGCAQRVKNKGNIYVHNHHGKGKKHIITCGCMTCKAKRGEYSGENNPMFGKFAENSPSFGRKHTEETKEKNRQAHLGKPLNHKPDCQCGVCKAKRGEQKGENSPLFGKPQTEEHRRHSAEVRRGKSHKEGCRCSFCKAKNGLYFGEGNPHFGKPHSDETKEICRQANCGENNPQWKGGIGKEPYPYEFQKGLKVQIRDRDNKTCQICGKSEEANKTSLSVHHIDYNKSNLKKENLISLCISCHGRVGHNREFWIAFFQRLLELKSSSEDLEFKVCPKCGKKAPHSRTTTKRKEDGKKMFRYECCQCGEVYEVEVS